MWVVADKFGVLFSRFVVVRHKVVEGFEEELNLFFSRVSDVTVTLEAEHRCVEWASAVPTCDVVQLERSAAIRPALVAVVVVEEEQSGFVGKWVFEFHKPSKVSVTGLIMYASVSGGMQLDTTALSGVQGTDREIVTA